MKNVRFNVRRAEKVFLEACGAYREQRLLFSRAGIENAPQNTAVPGNVERGSFPHAVFLYFTTLITYASDSDMVFKQSVHLFEKYQYLFSEKLLEISVEEIGERFREVGFVRPKQGAGYWYGSGRTLFSEYQGEPLRLFAVENVDEFLLKKRALKKRFGKEALPGIGPKIFSLMAIFFHELGLIPEMPGAFPVDLHVQRICIAQGIIEGNGVSFAAPLAEFLRPRIYEVCERLGMRTLDLSHALWLLGHLGCTICPFVEGIEHVCPIASSCGGAPPSLLYARKGKWNLDAPRLRKGSIQSSLFLDNPEVILDVAQHGRRNGFVQKNVSTTASSGKERFFGKDEEQFSLLTR